MNTFLVILISSLASAVVGSLLLWIGLGIYPGSTAGFDLSVYVSILCFSCAGVFITGCIALPLTATFIKTIQSPKSMAIIAAVGGAIIYLCVNVLIASLSGERVIVSFFRSGAFLFPVLVGLLFGGCFGYAYKYFRLLLFP